MRHVAAALHANGTQSHLHKQATDDRASPEVSGAELMPNSVIKSINVSRNTVITDEFPIISGLSDDRNGLITSMQMATATSTEGQNRRPLRQASNQHFKMEGYKMLFRGAQYY